MVLFTVLAITRRLAAGASSFVSVEFSVADVDSSVAFSDVLAAVPCLSAEEFAFRLEAAVLSLLDTERDSS